MPKRSALNYALYLLGRRGRSRFELKSKLLEKNYPAEVVDIVLKRLTEMNLLDDRQFAQNYARDKVAIYRRGKYRIGLELHQRGVSKEIITEALETVEETDELQAAISLLQGRARSWSKLHARKRFERAVALLQRRGFSGKVIRAAIEQLETKSSP